MAKSDKVRKVHGISSVQKISKASAALSDDDDDYDDKAAMLAALQAHGRVMFGFNEPLNGESSAQGALRMATSSDDQGSVDEDSEGDGEGSSEGGAADESDESEVEGHSSAVQEVVFAGTSRGRDDASLSKNERRAFLNGKSSKLLGFASGETSTDSGRKRRRDADEDDDDEDDQSNRKLDKTLHEMLLTNLLPSSTLSTARRPIDKQKAISGRLLELAKYELPGQGSSSLSKASFSTHSAKIRTGIIHARDKREEEARKEAEAASWVRGIGTVSGKKKTTETGRQRRAGVGVEVGKKKGMESRKDGERDRGLTMGIGKFRNGMLSLSQREIARGSAKVSGGPRFKGKKRSRKG
ncbi:hypothetical protein BD324DRAFT_619209 [Kockovaella imperatae]|uniref:Protein FAF1 n=1 Tax=Kockovaella imperatae TaxID=4999 RepID=A0A1Y1UQ86_9TREE|nr:hypothetical protein BD324DRAFT_619209 [Kockovaella imperatae]ORX39305.1 hypothetical protein BD324DRAFT_619209 [Kockovaella imperatae]